MTPKRATPKDRAVAALGALACLALLLVAALLTPSAGGHGTHTQLRMPECGWISSFDKPCPTCGMTTAFANAADGRFSASFAAQPAGTLLALASAAAFWTLLHTALFGSRIARIFRPLWTTRWLLVFGAALLLAWVYKITTWNG